MAYDEELAARVRSLLAQQPGWSEQRMFGGLGLLREGHLAVAVSGQGGLMVRHDPTDGLDEQAHTAPVVMRDQEMAGWLVVEAPGYETWRVQVRYPVRTSRTLVGPVELVRAGV